VPISEISRKYHALIDCLSTLTRVDISGASIPGHGCEFDREAMIEVEKCVEVLITVDSGIRLWRR
jgi:hypothetical protein